MNIRKLTALILAAALALAAIPFASGETPTVKTEIKSINKYGNIELTVKTPELLGQGFEYGDWLSVTVAGETIEMPLFSNYSEVGEGEMICRASQDPTDNDKVSIAINMGDMATALAVAQKVTTDEEPGYRWEYRVETPVAVILSVKEKGRYASTGVTNPLTRSLNRADYPNLTDAEYANFREITTTGMGAGTLYRSSTPINPKLNRNKEADAALEAAGVRTIINMIDDKKAMESYEGYSLTHYSARDVIPLGMSMDYTTAEYTEKTKEGLLFLIAHEGPYLLHCEEGRHRTGLLSALLESLMGASAEEVVADYMVTYYNYYGVQPGTNDYDVIRAGNIEQILSTVFGINDIYQADLAACAEKYFLSIGLTDADVAALKAALAKPCRE